MGARTESQRCIALLANASDPNAAAVTAGTNAQGTCPAAASQTGGSSFSLACTGLTAGTAYKVWCATDTSAVLSSVATITPTAPIVTTTTVAPAPATSTISPKAEGMMSVGSRTVSNQTLFFASLLYVVSVLFG